MAELNDYFYLLFFQSSMKYMEIPILKLSKKKKYTIIFISMQKQGISVYRGYIFQIQLQLNK